MAYSLRRCVLWGFLALLLTRASEVSALPATAKVNLRTVDASGEVLPARVHLVDAEGKAVEPDGWPFYRDHFNFDGDAVLDLPVGEYRFTIERGPEYRRATGTISVADDSRGPETVVLHRLTDLNRRGWWCGDVHIHRDPEVVPLLMASEDLNVGPILTVWNQRNHWSNRELPGQLVQEVGENRWIHLLACEDERKGGALLYFNLSSPLDFRGDGGEYPSPLKNLTIARKLAGAWIDIEKPFWWDVPTWVATGRIDSIGLANNHMCRSRMFESEAWGRPRDVTRLPPPRGNGFFTQELYYRLLNCGFRISPSAGSASGVLPNPVGYNRVYVYLGDSPSYEAWWRGLKVGRSFVTNGPLLLVNANGKLPGSVFQVGENLGVEIDVQVLSNDSIDRVELVVDGNIASVDKPNEEGKVAFKTSFKTSGWFLVRVIASVSETFRFASTAPFYVEVAGKKSSPRREDVQYFIDWIEERMQQIEGRSTKEFGPFNRESALRLLGVLKPHEEALLTFRTLLERSI